MRRLRMIGRRSRKCGKFRYATIGTAHSDADRLTAVGDEGKNYTAYLCPGCGWWHLTTTKQRRRAAAKGT